jgi:predicted membrane-bound spermidine synthase
MTVQQMSTQLILSTLMTLTTAILIRFHQLILAMMQTANFIITLMISHLMTNQLALQSLMSLLTTMTAHLKNIQTLNSNQKLLTSVTLLTFHLDTSTTQTRDSTSFLNLQQSLMKTTV